MSGSRLDAELVRRGLARARKEASELVAAGRVRLDGAVVSKASTPVAPGQRLEVEGRDDDPRYTSRAAHKLAGALDALDASGATGAADPAQGPAGAGCGLPVAGAVCLDLGASTGGFTDVLLRRGAAHVTAVDVGHGQMVAALREDPRVSVREGLNVRDLVAEDLGTPSPTLVVGDLSFISLTLVVPAVAPLVAPGALLLLLVKPQFEVGRERLGSGGVVRDREQQADAVARVLEVCARHGLAARAVVPSALPGPSGNREFFVLLRAGGAPPGPDPAHRAAARRAVAWDPPATLPGRTPATPPVVRLGAAGTP
ncbi:TlyA family RNA methyltransferase [Cellulomonas sp. PhB143]|uniref:TlyA family RNA methyltransferase n=1 Tax=Cellulomonas sp. PhB143 TaxID=2485186 RepID=UPI000F47B79A|nr:TlyA family RNA methyltransferase [Cellulomonas sp. PhB143]ROS74293.1 23S rRNA (cytidine1920-2'-O)/16S rRNA (cytidine1409-2'-O)-methyltransferase [Cellulomonas sp. PhB143]